MVTPEIESKWYVALYEEDCRQVMQLLTDYRDLLLVGWEDDDREVEGYGRFWMPRKQSKWKGRTALHVGARRGCLQLVEQILRLTDLGALIEDFSNIKRRIEEEKGSAKVTEFPRDQSRRAKIGGADRNSADLSAQASGPIVADVQGRGTSSFTEDGEITIEIPRVQFSLAERRKNSSGYSAPNVESAGDRMISLAQTKLALWQDQMSADRRALTRWKRFKEHENKVQERDRNWNRGKGKLQRLEGFRKIGIERYGKSSRTAKFTHERLISSKDGEYKLDALAIAALHGNHDIITLLSLAMLECETPPYQTTRDDIIRYARDAISLDETKSKVLRNVTEAAFEQDFKTAFVQDSPRSPHDPTAVQLFVNCYNNHPDFNFLPRDMYLFHFIFTDLFHKILYDDWAKDLRKAFWKKIRSSSDPRLWRFILELRDGQGRTPLHVAVDESTVWDFCHVIKCDDSDEVREMIMFAMQARDGAGRTALHRAVARGQKHALNAFLAFEEDYRDVLPIDVLPIHTPSEPRSFPFRADDLSRASGFEGYRTSMQTDTSNRTVPVSTEIKLFPRKDTSHRVERSKVDPSTPLDSAIILKNTRIFKPLGKWIPQHPSETRFTLFLKAREEEELPSSITIKLDIMELATLLGDLRVVRKILKDGYQKVPRQYSEEENGIWNHPWPALHLAATFGSYEMLKMFLDDPFCDPFIEDFEGNSPLHHALKVRTIEFKTHLLDYVDCGHIISNDKGKVSKKVVSERQSCINLLLQSGCDIFKVNKKKRTPYPQGSWSTAEGFLSWWNDKQEKEFGAIQNTLNIATNAITVTAALVATASFIGPLQPPRGYADNQIQDKNIWVRIFIFCNTIAFYLAIASIIFSLIPSLPILQQGMVNELRRTRRMVTLAVGMLFPSIVGVLVAFGSSSIAVASSLGAFTPGQSLSLAGISVCAPFILAGSLLFFIRVLGICFPSSPSIRYIYKATLF